MRVMVFHTVNEEAAPDMTPTPEMLEAFQAMDKFTEELVEAGVFVAAAGLKPSAVSKRIEVDGGKKTVIDGPFTEARELVAGFSIWEVKDMDEAMAWAMRAPVVTSMSGAMEVRPFYEVEDLGDFISEEEKANPRGGDRGKLGVA